LTKAVQYDWLWDVLFYTHKINVRTNYAHARPKIYEGVYAGM
jgi:hypothetical protein